MKREAKSLSDLFPHGLQAIVLGGSAGSFAVLKSLFPALPKHLPCCVLVVVHLPPGRPSAIAQALGGRGDRPMKEGEDKEPIEDGTVYFAPSGYHMLVETDRSLALSADEPVYYSRPSIDVLFESAADVFGDKLLGVVLSGANQDGAAGLRAIHDAGGVTVVQSPESAESPQMPSAAIAACQPTWILRADEIAELFAQLDETCFKSAVVVSGGHDV